MMDKEFKAYTYQYNCKKKTWWWGSYRKSGVRNMIHIGNKTSAEQSALEDAMKKEGSSNCDISLLQRFKITIQLEEPYPTLVKFPLSTGDTIKSIE
jgi:hypothetical protein